MRRHLLSIDSNILIAIFIVVALFAYIFVLRKLRPEIVPLKHITKQTTNKTNNKHVREKKSPPKETQSASPLKSEPLCTHEFGYLGTLPKNSKIPDECLGCSRIVKCLAEGRSRD
jgi:hypothetical protein